MIDYSLLLQSFIKNHEIVFPSFEAAEDFCIYLNQSGYAARIYELPRILFDLSAGDLTEKVFVVSLPKNESLVHQ